MKRRVNRKRLALSLGIAGAICYPIYTGSIVRFLRYPAFPSITFPDLDPRSITAEDIACDIFKEKDSCEKAKSQPDYPLIQRTEPAHINSIGLFRTLRDALAGAFIPASAVLLLPVIARRYFRWLMSENSK